MELSTVTIEKLKNVCTILEIKTKIIYRNSEYGTREQQQATHKNKTRNKLDYETIL